MNLTTTIMLHIKGSFVVRWLYSANLYFFDFLENGKNRGVKHMFHGNNACFLGSFWVQFHN